MKNKTCLWRFVVFGALVFSSHTLAGQEVFFPSPESSAMINTITTGVDLYSGTAPISIPLHTISLGNVQIPISISYQGSGIKVEDVATRVGLGWRLSAGGRISRIIRGAPDESGYSNPSGLTKELIEKSRANNWDVASFESYHGRGIDVEPDLFYYEIPGRSGMFILDTAGKAHTIPYEPIHIEYISTAGPPRFSITDSNGLIYIFNTRESSSQKPVSHVAPYWLTTSWCLDEIKDSPMRGERSLVQFKYSQSEPKYLTYYNYNDSETYTAIKHNGQLIRSCVSSENLTTITEINEQVLDSILWNNGKVLFTANTPRKDFPALKALTSLDIYGWEKRIKSIDFDYSEFANNSLKLIQISQRADNDLREILYNFAYNSQVSLPKRDSPSTDHWGYYNGSFTSSGRVFPSHTCLGVRVDGVNKEPQMPYTTADILTEIVYKNGGRKVFEYEANTIQAFDKTAKKWAGVRIRQIKEYYANNSVPSVTQYEYTDEEGYSSGEAYNQSVRYSLSPFLQDFVGQQGDEITYTLYRKNLSTLFDLSGSALVYSRVKEILPNGSYRVYHYQGFKSIPDTNADVTCVFPSHVELHYPNSQGFPKTSMHWKRGLLLHQENYTADGELQLSQEYVYQIDAPAKTIIPCYVLKRDSTTTGLSIRETLYRYIASYQWISQPIYLREIITQGVGTLSFRETYVYDTTYLGVIESHRFDTDGNHFLTKTSYPYSYPLPETSEDPQITALIQLRKSHMTNAVVEKVQVKNDRVTAGELFMYKYYKGQPFVTHTGESLHVTEHKTLRLQEAVSDWSAASIASGQFVQDSRYRTDVQYVEYNSDERLSCVVPENGIPTAYLYGYSAYGSDAAVPIAVATNVQGHESMSDTDKKQEIYHTSFEDNTFRNTIESPLAKSGRKVCVTATQIVLYNYVPGNYQLSYWQSADNGKSWTENTRLFTIGNISEVLKIGADNIWVDEVRVYPVGSMMTTYTHLPGVGITSQTDANGKTIYYEYDGFGRLSAVRDNDRNLLESYEYK